MPDVPQVPLPQHPQAPRQVVFRRFLAELPGVDVFQVLVQLFQDTVELPFLQGLEQVIPDAEAQRLLHILKVRIAAHNDKIDIRVGGLGLFDQLQPRHARHAQVCDDGVGVQLSNFVKQLKAVKGLSNDGGVGVFDQHFAKVHNTRLIIGDHNRQHADASFPSRTPGRTENCDISLPRFSPKSKASFWGGHVPPRISQGREILHPHEARGLTPVLPELPGFRRDPITSACRRLLSGAQKRAAPYWHRLFSKACKGY